MQVNVYLQDCYRTGSKYCGWRCVDTAAHCTVGSYSATVVSLKKFIAQTGYTVCTRISYEVVPVTSLNKYLHHGTSGIKNMYINICANNGSEKIWEKTNSAAYGKLTKEE
jgi:hypothetical protein